MVSYCWKVARQVLEQWQQTYACLLPWQLHPSGGPSRMCFANEEDLYALCTPHYLCIGWRQTNRYGLLTLSGTLPAPWSHVPNTIDRKKILAPAGLTCISFNDQCRPPRCNHNYEQQFANTDTQVIDIIGLHWYLFPGRTSATANAVYKLYVRYTSST